MKCYCVCVQSPSHKSKRQQQELIAELRKKQVKDSRHVYEGKDGAIEDIITGNLLFADGVCMQRVLKIIQNVVTC